MNLQQEMRNAVAHHQAGRLDQAERIYRSILEQQPNHPDALHLLGVAAMHRGQNEAAVQYISRAIAQRSNPLFHSNLSQTLMNLNRLDEALAAAQRAVRVQENSPEAHHALGKVLLRRSQWDAAITSFQTAVRLRPDYAEAHNNLGTTFGLIGRLDEAIDCYRAAARLMPNLAMARMNLGNLLARRGKHDEAIAELKRAIELQPSLAQAHNTLAFTLVAVGAYDEAMEELLKTLALTPNDAELHSNYLLALNYRVREPQEVFDEHVRWAKQHASRFSSASQPISIDRTPGRKLRIGYVSPDFRLATVAMFIAPILEHHDRRRFHITCYADISVADNTSHVLRGFADDWRMIFGLPDERVAQMIREDRIDILVDLAGHTGRNRLLVFARKPAPVQVSYLGYPNTTGLATMDWRVTDASADPPETSDHWYTEKLVRLPRTFLAYRPPHFAADVVPPPSETSEFVTFGSFNNFVKVTPQWMKLWARILQAVPNSRLLLKAIGLASEAGRRYILSTFARERASEDRIILLGHAPTYHEHLATYAQIDIALDTFPYNGTTTTCEALWMGVPVITRCGNVHAQRVGASLLSGVGLSDLITHSDDEYIKKVIELASDPSRLSNLRRTMRQRMKSSPLMNELELTRQLEQAYQHMWQAVVSS